MKKTFTPVLLIMMLTVFSVIIPTGASTASAATSATVYTNVQAKLPLVTHATPLSGAAKVYSYSSSALTTQQTGYYIDTFTDQIVVTQMTSDGKAVSVTYPSSSSSTGYRSFWFATDDILGLSAVSVASYTASAGSTTYALSSASAVKSYGSIAAKDACVKLGSRVVGGTTYYPTVYPITSQTVNKVSGVKYKLALATTPGTTSTTSDKISYEALKVPIYGPSNSYIDKDIAASKAWGTGAVYNTLGFDTAYLKGSVRVYVAEHGNYNASTTGYSANYLVYKDYKLTAIFTEGSSLPDNPKSTRGNDGMYPCVPKDGEYSMKFQGLNRTASTPGPWYKIGMPNAMPCQRWNGTGFVSSTSTAGNIELHYGGAKSSTSTWSTGCLNLKQNQTFYNIVGQTDNVTGTIKLVRDVPVK